MRISIFRILTVIGAGMIVLSITGCEPKGPKSRPQTPPAAPQAAATGQQYSYDHKPLISKAERQQIRNEFVVAVARVGDTTIVEGSTFGDQTAIETAGTDNLTVKVSGQDDTNITIESKTDKKLRPEPVPPGFTLAARSQIISYLQESRYFTVVERDSINDILREIEFGQSKWTEEDDISGKLKGVRYIIKGDLSLNLKGMVDGGRASDNWVGDTGFPDNINREQPFVFRLRMYRVETGVIVAAGEGHGQIPQEALKRALDDLVAEALRDYRERKPENQM